MHHCKSHLSLVIDNNHEQFGDSRIRHKFLAAMQYTIIIQGKRHVLIAPVTIFQQRHGCRRARGNIGQQALDLLAVTRAQQQLRSERGTDQGSTQHGASHGLHHRYYRGNAKT